MERIGMTTVTFRTRCAQTRIKAFWFNPCQNASQLIGEFRKREQQSFTPPSSGRNNDWILVIDGVARNLPGLGYSHQNLVPTVEEE
jgi:hypothetical protein